MDKMEDMRNEVSSGYESDLESVQSVSPKAVDSPGRSLSLPCRARRRRDRTLFTPRDLYTLEGVFSRDRYPDINLRMQLALELGITEDRVQVWFQNRRSRNRRVKKSTNIARTRTPELSHLLAVTPAPISEVHTSRAGDANTTQQAFIPRRPWETPSPTKFPSSAASVSTSPVSQQTQSMFLHTPSHHTQLSYCTMSPLPASTFYATAPGVFATAPGVYTEAPGAFSLPASLHLHIGRSVPSFVYQ